MSLPRNRQELRKHWGTGELRERLAENAHDAWSRWMKHLIAKCDESDGTLVIPVASVTRWRRQIATPYAELSEPEKESDRAEADKIIELIKPKTKPS